MPTPCQVSLEAQLVVADARVRALEAAVEGRDAEVNELRRQVGRVWGIMYKEQRRGARCRGQRAQETGPFVELGEIMYDKERTLTQKIYL